MGTFVTGGFPAESCEFNKHVTSGENNVAAGLNALPVLTEGSNNVAIDKEALHANTSGNSNIAVGSSALQLNTSGHNNQAYGVLALDSNKTGVSNIAIGSEASQFNESGSDNIAIGDKAGREVLKSLNIDIVNAGVATDEKTTRIGAEGDQTKAFVAGVQNSNVSGCSVQVTSAGQLGCNNNQAGSAVATYKSTKKSLPANASTSPPPPHRARVPVRLRPVGIRRAKCSRSRCQPTERRCRIWPRTQARP